MERWGAVGYFPGAGRPDNRSETSDLRTRGANLWLWFAALLVFLVAPLSAARAEVELGKRLALVVGNSSYQQIQSLRNAAADAEVVAQTLSDLGFRVTLLQNATRPQMEAAIADIKAEGQNAEAVLFYYSGHGFQLRGSNFLVPTDASLKDRAMLDKETIELNTLINELGDAGRPTIILIDACRNSPLSADVLGQEVASGLAQVSASIDNTYVLFATQPGNISFDGAEANGPFALALQANLPLPDEDFVAVMKQVRADVKKRTAGLQTPWEQSSMMVDFEFNIGLMPGVLIADLGGPAVVLDPGPGLALDDPAGGPADQVAALDAPLLIEDLPEDLIRGTQVEGPALTPDPQPAVTPTIAESAPIDPIVPDPAPTPTTTTTVASVDPGQVLAPLDTVLPDNDVAVVTPTVGPTLTTTVEEPALDPVKVAEAVQSELKRVGCYTSVVDGDWGNGSRKALKKYFDTKKVTPLGTEPTMEIKAALAAETGVVCQPDPVQPRKPAVADTTPKKATTTTTTPEAEPKKPSGGLVIKPGSGSFR